MSATFILDGSNLAWLGPGEGASLAPVDAIADALRAEWPGCKVIALCDASLRHRLSAADKAEHERRTRAGELVEAPADEDADAYILESARRLGGCVVTRDLYRDRREARAGVPMLRPALVGGAVILGDPKVFATADSDRGEALPADALGPRVAPAPLPGGEPVDAEPASTRDDAAASGAAPDASVAESAAETVEPDAAEEPSATAEDAAEDTADSAGAPEEPPSFEAAADEPPAQKAPTQKASAQKTPAKKAPSKPRKPRTKSSGSKARKSAPSTRSKGRASAAGPAPASRPLMVLALIVAAGALIGLARWVLVDEAPTLGVDDTGVLFARNCKGWRLAGTDERIVFHARSGHCTTSIAGLGGERYLVTVAEGETPETVGAVSLVVVEEGVEGAAIELTRGRAGAGDVPDERATARISGADPAAGVVALDVSPSVERAPLRVVRRIDGDVLAHTDALAGLALGPGGAAALRHHCPTGCGSVHIAGDISAALDAAQTAAPPAETGPRWAGPAAFSPDGARLAVAEAFVDGRGGVVIIDRATDARRRLPFEAREQTQVTGLAWTVEGLFLGASGALYRAAPDGDGGWQPVSRNPESLAPARP